MKKILLLALLSMCACSEEPRKSSGYAKIVCEEPWVTDTAPVETVNQSRDGTWWVDYNGIGKHHTGGCIVEKHPN